MYPLIRPLLFRVDSERIHALSIQAMRAVGRAAWSRALVRAAFGPGVDRPVEVMGLRFRNPVGLAAGYDKDGMGWRGLSALGFGHVEVGTVTPRPQVGNPTPRIFRLVEDEAIINRMGFPGRGAAFMARQLGQERPFGVVLGVNIGKNKDTSNESAHEDYTALVRQLAVYADYLAVNVSSPNTEGLRSLQARQALLELLTPIRAERDAQVAALGRAIPLTVKLSPDLDDAQLDDALDVLLEVGVDGVIATNTTLARDGLRSSFAGERGGLSGAPLTERSTQLVKKIARRTEEKLPIIGVGGIMTPDDVKARLDAGASLVQVYTGLIYSGPTMVRQILRAL